MGDPTRDAINLAYQETMKSILTVAVCVAAPCVILSFFMKNYKLDEIDQHVKGVVVGGVQEVADRRDTDPFPESSRRSPYSTDDDRISDQQREPLIKDTFQRSRKGS